MQGLYQNLEEFDFKELLDDGLGYKTKEVTLDTLDQTKQYSAASALFQTSISHPSTTSIVASRLSQAFGIYDGEYFRTWIEEKSYIKTGIQNITFKELHDLVEKDPDIYKDLFVVGTNLSNQSVEVFSYQHTPDVIVADAVRISMSIPLVFKPHLCYIKNTQGERVVGKDAHLYVDGGLVRNYPITIFDNPCFYQAHLLDSNANPSVLGFRLLSKEKKDYFEGKADRSVQDIAHFTNFFKALLFTIKGTQENYYTDQDKNRSICINTAGIDMLDFNLNENQKIKLIESGREAVQNFSFTQGVVFKI